ncbi:MAG: hypothetical protein JHC40_02640 [Burkholderiales bacterium]|jgi:hypothetical protein|nr:hypothetical protein [Burkholderiales bacterium]
MKTYSIELQQVKAMRNQHGTIEARIAAVVQPQSAIPDEDEAGEPLSVLSMTEETARVLMLLLKVQLAEFDKRKARSRF